MDFAELIAPIAPDRFAADHWGKTPLHIPTPPGATRAGAVSWARFNTLLGIRAHWSEPHCNLVLNSRPVMREYWTTEHADAGGAPRRLADPAKLQPFFAMGASFVANQVEDIDADVRAIVAMLARRFGGKAGANLYASFKGVQAFDSHFDTHEVFALQCEGAKRWRVYANRADNPLEVLSGDGAQAEIDRLKGPVLLDVTTRPGDVLYIPRGYFHDAIATDTASLHLTLAVAPPSGRLLLQVLDELAIAESAFRAYLPAASVDGGRALAARLGELGGLLQELARSPGALEAVAVRQARLAEREGALALPERPALTSYARTDRPAAVIFGKGGAMLRHGGGEATLGMLGEVADWALAQRGWSVEQLQAEFPHHDARAVAALAQALERAGLVRPFG